VKECLDEKNKERLEMLRDIDAPAKAQQAK